MKMIIKPKKITRKNFKKFGDVISTKKIKSININNGYAKFVLREAVKDTLNEKVRLDRRKKGFNASINSIFNLSDKKTTNYLLADSPLFDMIKKEKVEELLKKDFFENSYNKFIFNLLNVKLFLEEHSN